MQYNVCSTMYCTSTLIYFHIFSIYNIGKWCKKLYKVNMIKYKVVMKNWYSGKGAGSGESTMLQEWVKAKLDKYNLNPSVYHHSEIKDCPTF